MVKRLVKIVCRKLECPICKVNTSAQLFLRKDNSIRYIRFRHYLKLDKDSRKPLFKYHSVENLEEYLQTLEAQGIKLNIEEPLQNRSLGHIQQKKEYDLNLKDSNHNLRNILWAGSSVRTEHHPPKVGVVGSNPTPPALT